MSETRSTLDREEKIMRARVEALRRITKAVNQATYFWKAKKYRDRMNTLEAVTADYMVLGNDSETVAHLETLARAAKLANLQDEIAELDQQLAQLD